MLFMSIQYRTVNNLQLKPFGLKMASECYIRGSSRYHQWEGEMGVGMWGCGWCLAKMKSLKLKVHDIMTG